MALRAVLLDVGNTLLRERPSRFAIYAAAARRRGVGVSEAEMLALMRRAHEELPRELDGAFRYSDPWFAAYIERIFGRHLGLPAGDVPAVVEELFARFEDARTFRLFPGAVELLELCRARGLVVGAVSNWSARLPRVLDATGLAPRLDLVVCSALVRAEKPEPEIFRIALERAGVAPAEALHAGDHLERDGRGAAAAGLEAVVVDPARRLPPGGADGVGRVDDLPGLARHILSRLA